MLVVIPAHAAQWCSARTGTTTNGVGTIYNSKIIIKPFPCISQQDIDVLLAHASIILVFALQPTEGVSGDTTAWYEANQFYVSQH